MAEIVSDRIEVQCACGKRLKVPAAAAGRRAKCPTCGAVFTVPGSKPDQAEPTNPRESDDGLLGELARQAQSAPTAVSGNAAAGAMSCPLCNKPMATGARICVGCGYDTQTGRTMKGASAKTAAVAGAVGKSARWTGRFAFGLLLSGAGAVLGAVIWVAVVAATH